MESQFCMCSVALQTCSAFVTPKSLLYWKIFVSCSFLFALFYSTPLFNLPVKLCDSICQERFNHSWPNTVTFGYIPSYFVSWIQQNLKQQTALMLMKVLLLFWFFPIVVLQCNVIVLNTYQLQIFHEICSTEYLIAWIACESSAAHLFLLCYFALESRT